MIDKLKYYARYNYILEIEIKKIENYFSLNNFEDFKESYIVKYVNDIINSNSFYRSYYSKYGVNINQIQTLNDVDDLPILEKDTVIRNSKKILGKFHNPIKFIGHTSGTSGTPLRVYRSFRSVIKENAYVWWYRRLNGLNYKDKKVSLRGDLDANELYKYDKTSNTLYISSYRINRENFNKIFSMIQDFRPKGILAYPSTLFTLVNLMKEKGQQLEIPLCFTSSETLFSFQKKSFEQYLNSVVLDWYGNAERTIALYSSNDRYFEPPLYSYFKILDSDCGIATTSLINTMFPLINYKVDDDIEICNDYSADKKSKIFKNIHGRIEDYILLPNGSKIKRLGYVFKGIKGIKFSQIIQSSQQEVLFNIVADTDFDEKNLEKLKKNIYSRLGNEINVKISFIEQNEIIYTASNKYKLIISNLELQ